MTVAIVEVITYNALINIIKRLRALPKPQWKGGSARYNPEFIKKKTLCTLYMFNHYEN